MEHSLRAVAAVACGRRGAGTELRHGLGILKFGRNSPDGTCEWAVSVWFTVLFMVVCLVMAVIAMVADRFVSRTYEFVLTAMATVLLLSSRCGNLPSL